jgi:CubicO group peptidase (beta-lactamase class C family)
MAARSRLPRATPESAGVDSSAIAAFVTAANERSHALHSLMVVRHGTVVAEGWWRPYSADQRHMMFSVSKSVTATAIGLAQAEGLLSVDEPVLSFFPSYATAEVTANVANLRVRDLLTMSTGHAVDTMEIMRALPHEDWVRVFLGVPIEYPPGTHFLYNSGASFVLAAIVAARTGQSVREYVTPRLFEPLGIQPPPWETNGRGINLGASGLRITTEDLAKLGMLYLQQGRWKGRRVLPEVWVEQASSRQVANGADPDDDWNQGYGFQMWRSRHNSFRMDGRYGQFSVVLPEQDAVIAITAGIAEGHPILSTLWETLLPGVHDDPLPADETAHIGLLDLLASQEIPTPVYLERPPLGAGRLMDREIRVPFNTLHVTSVQLGADRDTIRLTTVNDLGEAESVSAGRRSWQSGVTSLWPYEEMSRAVTASKGGWIDDTTLEVHQQCIETPFARLWRFHVHDDGHVTVSVRLDNGFWVDREEVLDELDH